MQFGDVRGLGRGAAIGVVGVFVPEDPQSPDDLAKDGKIAFEDRAHRLSGSHTSSQATYGGGSLVLWNPQQGDSSKGIFNYIQEFQGFISPGIVPYWETPREYFWLADQYGYTQNDSMGRVATDKVRILYIFNTPDDAALLPGEDSPPGAARGPRPTSPATTSSSGSGTSTAAPPGRRGSSTSPRGPASPSG